MEKFTSPRQARPRFSEHTNFLDAATRVIVKEF
jgi:hypothetical protein